MWFKLEFLIQDSLSWINCSPPYKLDIIPLFLGVKTGLKRDHLYKDTQLLSSKAGF